MRMKKGKQLITPIREMTISNVRFVMQGFSFDTTK